MKDKELLNILYDNLEPFITPKVAGTIYDTDLIVALAMREVGWKVAEKLAAMEDIKAILTNMRGDYDGKKYHGYSPYQIDDRSYPGFIKSGDWKDLDLATAKCIEVLEEKRKYLVSKGWDNRLEPEMLMRAILASYNCGQGNVNVALLNKKDVDYYTFNKDYSKEVLRYKAILQEEKAIAVKGTNQNRGEAKP